MSSPYVGDGPTRVRIFVRARSGQPVNLSSINVEVTRPSGAKETVAMVADPDGSAWTPASEKGNGWYVYESPPAWFDEAGVWTLQAPAVGESWKSTPARLRVNP
jgi:hypothetical protein